MRSWVRHAGASLFVYTIAAPVMAGECPGNPDALGTSRTLQVDTSGGPLIGTLQYEDTLKLRPSEVVLTFDDGPYGRSTRRILAALNGHCVKATFFPIGLRAARDPALLRSIAESGHTIGTHSWSHPGSLAGLSADVAYRQIERGFDAVKAAIGRAAAPFLRLPGLNDSKKLKDYAARRDYAIFSTDIGTDDWRGISSRSIVLRTMRRLRYKGRGIVLFHDTKSTTAAALPLILRRLKRDGYKVVHIVPRKGGGKTDRSELAAASQLPGDSTNQVAAPQPD